ncbi:MAG: Ger(x)C family spore germination protein [Desulfurispora sp.]|uniref:Ger(x)C family spore germination protein n=1 Tax=Desulfurispora sp. TaxID=3014275 RepID=UPI00404AF31C
MKKLPRLTYLFFLALLLPLSGCWDKTEVENLNIVIGAAVDRLPTGQLRIICQTVDQPQRQMSNPNGSQGSGSINYHNWLATGYTLFDAIHRLTLVAPHRFYWPHCRVIIISEQLARQDIVSILDFLERDAEIKRSMWILIARDKPEDILAAGTQNKLPPARLLAESLDIRHCNSWYAVSRLNQFMRQLSTPGREAFTAGVESVPGLMRRDLQAAGSGPDLHEPRLTHTALFRSGQLVGWLNEQQSRGLLWLLGEVKKGIVPVKLNENMISFEVVGSQSKIEPSLQDGELEINISLKVDANIGEVSPGLEKLDSAVIKELEAALSEHVRQDITAALAAMQSLGSDAAGLGEAVYRQYPARWQESYAGNWPEIFSSLSYTIDVHSRVRGLGRINISPRPL